MNAQAPDEKKRTRKKPEPAPIPAEDLDIPAEYVTGPAEGDLYRVRLSKVGTLKSTCAALVKRGYGPGTEGAKELLRSRVQGGRSIIFRGLLKDVADALYLDLVHARCQVSIEPEAAHPPGPGRDAPGLGPDEEASPAGAPPGPGQEEVAGAGEGRAGGAEAPEGVSFLRLEPVPAELRVQVEAEAHGRSWSVYQADCVRFARQLPNASVDLAAYSPPFANVYMYSDRPEDHGNCDDYEEFMEGYQFLSDELYRIVRPGRIVAVHCKEIVQYAGRDGMAGYHDLPGDIIRVHTRSGFAFHDRIPVWKCPVEEARKSNNHGLLYKQLRADSTHSRTGTPEYVVLFRRWPKNEAEAALVRPVTHTKESFPLPQWQDWASPVWMDIEHKNVLNAQIARDDKDERHMCPLSLDLIDRWMVMYSRPGETVFSPYAGVGSEGVGALRRGRRFVGCELKPSYFQRAVVNLRGEEKAEQGSLFG